jgi:uncharacterized RDD family membrane protein YckC
MKMEKAELMSYILIIVGITLLILTFVMAVILVTSELGILSQSDLSQALGEILGPIAAAVIRVLYLGIMGWTSSIATIRGIQLYKEAKRSLPTKTETSKEQE